MSRPERAAQSAARGEQGRLRIGIAPTAPFHPLVPTVIRAFREAYPAVSVTLDECLSRQAVLGLTEARLDAAFVRVELPEAHKLTVHRLIDEAMVVAMPATHPLASRGTATRRRLSEFAEESFIAFARVEGPGIFDATVAACLRAGFTPRLGQEAPRIASALGLVAVGLGVSLVPASMRRVHMDGVTYCDLSSTERPTVPLHLATRRGSDSAVLRNFVRLVRETARADADAHTAAAPGV